MNYYCLLIKQTSSCLKLLLSLDYAGLLMIIIIIIFKLSRPFPVRNYHCVSILQAFFNWKHHYFGVMQVFSWFKASLHCSGLFMMEIIIVFYHSGKILIEIIIFFLLCWLFFKLKLSLSFYNAGLFLIGIIIILWSCGPYLGSHYLFKKLSSSFDYTGFSLVKIIFFFWSCRFFLYWNCHCL